MGNISIRHHLVDCFAVDWLMNLLSVQAIDTQIPTARTLLEPLTGEHAKAMFDGLQASAIYAWISSTPPSTVAQLEEEWQRLQARLADPHDVTYFNWAVRRLEDEALLGQMDAAITTSGAASNIGYVFFPAYWNQGYATEAVAALSKHLAARGVLEQTAVVTQGNAASMKVLEKAGFVRSRIIPNNDVIRGVAVDDVEYVYRHAESSP